MLDSFLFSVNTVLPVFLIVILGAVLGKNGMIDEAFTTTADRLVFRVALPVMLFLEVANADFSTAFDWTYLLLCICGILAIFGLGCLLVPLFIKSDAKRGAFIQGIYRSNFAILAIPLAENMFGTQGSEKIAMMMPFAIFLFNVLAVIILSIYAPRQARQSFGRMLYTIARDILTNPLIIAVILAVPFLLFDLSLPQVLTTSLNYLSNLASPLALLCIGANLKAEKLKGRWGLALTASLIKTVAVPAVMVSLGAAIGLRDSSLGGVLILFGCPTAVSSYIMAKNMGSDYDLAAQIILLTTLLCALTLFFGSFLLRMLGLI